MPAGAQVSILGASISHEFESESRVYEKCRNKPTPFRLGTPDPILHLSDSHVEITKRSQILLMNAGSPS
jgi:hypothetical protein